jgi:Holliday junction resolvasome RuvABC endonuclease subunit
MMPEYLISVDPGWRGGGVAIFEGDSFVKSLTFNVEKSGDNLKALILLASQLLIPKGARRALVMESQYMGLNAAVMTKLIQARMAWEVVAIQQGYEVAHVAPKSWQSKLCSIPPKTKRDEVGTMYVRTAKLLSNGIDFKVDEAAAYLIGQFYIGEERFRQKTNRTWNDL